MTCFHYFAYGSNMNPARMRARGLHFSTAEAAVLANFRLRFNKQSHCRPEVSYANIEPALGSRVEGVLYALEDSDAIGKMDHFEGTPVRYSRERLRIHTPGRGAAASEVAWVYLANPAYINNQLMPEQNYLAHLLAGEAFLSAEYLAWLHEHDCHPSEQPGGELGLLFNV